MIPTVRNTWRSGASTPVPRNGLPLVETTIRACRITSWIPMMLTSVVSFVRVISCDTVAGTIRRSPWGSTTSRIACQWRSPIDAAASPCPRSSDTMPARMISASTAEL